MRNLTFDIDYTYCPKGHGDWIHVPTSISYPDIFWCEQCNLFYTPTVKAIKAEDINKNFNSDRAGDLIKMAEFIKWKKGLSYKDMPKK